MTTSPTHTEIATNWNLWREYCDPGATMTMQEWTDMSLTERVDILVACFGPEGEADHAKG